jgi:anti-sigma factor RsiW
MSCELVERQLDAYLDRELDEASSAAVREHVVSCAACRRAMASRQTLSTLVRCAPHYAAPDRVRERALSHSSAMSLRHVVLTAVAAALVLSIAIAGVSQWWPPPANEEASEAVENHLRSLMANHLFDVQSTDLHTVKPWFLGKLDFSPPVADLAPFGFPLVGGRLDYAAGRPIAALVYQRQKHTINLFVSPRAGNDARSVMASTLRGLNVRRWSGDQMSFCAVSDLNGAELDEFVGALHRHGL